ncbi:urease subunit beta [Saccharopolyspora sp. ASAGF58]|uniref:urease subunit beta n=1 Tax=Saccharopolyspora sp. ASAGF58 TaxID=2719023 RepID=UPI001446D296|nr:urease subunit beta [Saccharopolyspora sp. ASAGF58]
MVPGQVIPGDEPVSFNDEPVPPPPLPEGMPWRRTVWVKNLGTRAIQVGSHFHFYEANSGYANTESDASANVGPAVTGPKGLAVLAGADGDPVSEEEKRKLTAGYRLDIRAGTAWRFEPGCTYEVPLVALAGDGTVTGLSTRGNLKNWVWYPEQEKDSDDAETFQSASVGQDAVRSSDTARGDA